ncbi:MAG: UDP-N-acetylmuramoyl-tripeptide--D-alanyl-D-alanine ligase [Oscillospiraceae bacterium]|nr:UDP-N-acetylmuramoyl-tripeptide--D-alanyl-D-alanine ligase [Oscillospiraceae bacterium]
MEEIILYAAFLVSAIAASLRPAHMLQLASYQWPGYLRWLKSDAQALAKFAPAAFVALLSLWEAFFVNYIAAGLFLLWIWVVFPRKGAKKPFKLTARALRILIVTALLLALFPAAAHFAGGRFRLIILVVGYVGVLLLVALANLLLSPLQKAINNRYIRDAQKKLRPGLPVIGVTGSYGKTSVKTYIAHLLSLRYNVLATPESYNTPMGVVRTIRERLEASHNVFVCEMGARHVGDIREICDIVHPKHGVLTAIGTQHLETFKTPENIAKTKFELIGALPPDGLAFLAWGNEAIRRYGEKTPNAVRYAVSGDQTLDVRAENLHADARGVRFDIVTREGERESFTTSLLGAHNIGNITAAIAVALKLGIPLHELPPAVRSLKPAKHRLEMLPKGGGLTVIDDAYNANPAGAAAALEALSLFRCMKVIVTPGMVELGGSEEAENTAFGRAIAAVCDYTALVGAQTGPIRNGLREAGYTEDNVKTFTTFQEAYQWAVSLEAEEKVILIENDLPDNY